MSGGGSQGVPQDEKRAREHRMRYSAKKQVERTEMVLNKYRARAAAIMHAEGLHGTKEELPRGYVVKILRHRETGVRVRVLDNEAPDAPESAKTAVHRYAVECETHGTMGDSFDSVKAAMTAARRSNEWCSQCAGLMSATPKARNRARTMAKHTRRRDDMWP